jgi:hypothetical protein
VREFLGEFLYFFFHSPPIKILQNSTPKTFSISFYSKFSQKLNSKAQRAIKIENLLPTPCVSIEQNGAHCITHHLAAEKSFF